jgi:hypothetical protein
MMKQIPCFLSVFSFSGDPHLNFALSVLAELPSIPFGYLVVNRWGRRPMLVFMQLLSGKWEQFNKYSKLNSKITILATQIKKYSI